MLVVLKAFLVRETTNYYKTQRYAQNILCDFEDDPEADGWVAWGSF
jgi:hypothetical protein